MSLRLEQVFSDEATRELELVDMLIADIPTSYASQTIRYQRNLHNNNSRFIYLMDSICFWR